MMRGPPRLNRTDTPCPSTSLFRSVDGLVVVGGQAGLIPSLMAVEAGRSVCILAGAPRFYLGGNSRHTRNLRAMHDAPTSVLSEAYDEEERSEEHTSELQSLLRISYAVFCLKKKKKNKCQNDNH